MDEVQLLPLRVPDIDDERLLQVPQGLLVLLGVVLDQGRLLALSLNITFVPPVTSRLAGTGIT